MKKPEQLKNDPAKRWRMSNGRDLDVLWAQRAPPVPFYVVSPAEKRANSPLYDPVIKHQGGHFGQPIILRTDLL